MTCVTSPVLLVSTGPGVWTPVTVTTMPAVTRWMETASVNLVTVAHGVKTRVRMDILVTGVTQLASVNLTIFSVILYQAVSVNLDTLETIAVFPCQYMPHFLIPQIQATINFYT